MDAGRRSEIRQFVRANHPDRGGDPAEFAAGLQALRDRADRDKPDAAAAVTAYRKRRGLAAVAAWARRACVRDHREGGRSRVH